MRNERDAMILALIERLKSEVNVARKLSLEHTVLLLQIAVLDLQTVAHSISDDELRQFVDFIEIGTSGEKTVNVC
jgi:hypothetical protein